MTPPHPWPPERIRRLAKRLDITQADLAARCGVTERTIRNWVREDRADNYDPSGPACVALDSIATKLKGFE